MFYTDYLHFNPNATTWKETCDSFFLNVPRNFNFSYDVLDRFAKEMPHKEALYWTSDEEDDRSFSFIELQKEVNKTANYFVSLGVKKGDRVMILLRTRFEFWYMLLALHKIGAIAIPATVQLLPDDLVYRFKTADIALVIAIDVGKIQAFIDEACVRSKTNPITIAVKNNRKGWRNFTKEYGAFSDVFEKPQGDAYACDGDISVIYFTSGTSGEPKMVSHNFLYPLGHIVTAKFWQCVTDGGRHFTVAETGWAKALWGKIYGQWLCGSSVFAYDMNRFVPKIMLDKITTYKITSFCAPSTVYRYLVKEDFSAYDFSILTECTSAGEALPLNVFNTFKDKTGLSIREGYGQTELTLTTGVFAGMKIKPGCIGLPAPGYEIDIVDTEGNSCAAGEAGEIVLRLDKGHPFGMFEGYYKDRKSTENVFKNNLYHTCDIAIRDEEGFFWFQGRTDDLIKSAGYRISPFEVENILLKHPAVFECAVTGVKDGNRGNIMKASIVVKEGFNGSDELSKDILYHARSVGANYKVPRIIEFVNELPKTISGKVRRVEIREKHKTTKATVR
ncbi:MAG TPA: AMP-binding protein [Treponemataceae bacterium]|nr:AMP-binding protein [Treponemataceae bacterium]